MQVSRNPHWILLSRLETAADGRRLVNLAVSPGVKYKQSTMPFVQMENIAHFLRAIQMPPLSLPPHDVFLTVDLYERKDPAQVLQCLAAFSRRVHAIQPSKFPRSVDGLKDRGVGQSSPPPKPRSPVSPIPISSWSTKEDELTTAPAWNIHQYGYMGGATQGKLGVTFGARRQIINPNPDVPSLEEKERRLREAKANEERQRQEAEARRRQQIEEEERRAQEEEERRWAEETERLREKERREIEEEKRRWAEEQRQWEEEERRRLQEEKEAEERLEKERQRARTLSDARLNGQFLSQYQASQRQNSAEAERIKELERQLEEARERERQYERERQELRAKQAQAEGQARGRSRSRSRDRSQQRPVQPSYDLKSLEAERKLLRSEWQQYQRDSGQTADQARATSPSKASSPPPPLPSRPLPEPGQKPSRPLPATPSSNVSATSFQSPRAHESRTDRSLATNPAPSSPEPAVHRPEDYSSTAEIDAENRRRIAAQQKTKAGGWASKSLLEREMERERERQREWEENQRRMAEAKKKASSTLPATGHHPQFENDGPSQNRSAGVGVPGARRQIIGPRPPP